MWVSLRVHKQDPFKIGDCEFRLAFQWATYVSVYSFLSSLSCLSRLLSVHSSNSGSMEFTEESKPTSPAESTTASIQPDTIKSAGRAWPDDWRAYVALLGGWLLMFNSWYVFQGGCRSLILIARWQGFGQHLRNLSILLSEPSLARHQYCSYHPSGRNSILLSPCSFLYHRPLSRCWSPSSAWCRWRYPHHAWHVHAWH